MHEEIRVLRRHATRRPLRNRRPRRGHVHRDGRSLHLGWQQTILLLWLAVTIALVAVALVLNRGSRNGPCPEAWGAAVCTQQAPAHSPRPTAHNTAAGQVLLTDAITWLTPAPPDRSPRTRRPKPAGTGPGSPPRRPARPWLARAAPGGPDAMAGALRDGADPHPRPPARRRFTGPDMGETTRRGPPPRSARGDPRDPPGLGPVRTRPPRGPGRRRSRQGLPVPAGRPHARSRRSPVRCGP